MANVPAKSVRSEFTVKNAYQYDHRSPARWVISHIGRYKFFFIGSVLLYICAFTFYTYSHTLIGNAVNEVLHPSEPNGLIKIALLILGLLTADGLFSLIGALSIETIAQRLEADGREELYANLLGKSQTFHNRQRVGDLMARATDDVQQLNAMMNPGVSIMIETVLGFLVPIIFIGTINLRLLVIPLIFMVVYI